MAVHELFGFLFCFFVIPTPELKTIDYMAVRADDELDWTQLARGAHVTHPAKSAGLY
jgi:hypothetical protein